MEIIKIIRFGKKTENICAICLENIREKKIRNLYCNHKLHKKCFKYLISTSNFNNQCPTCRAYIGNDVLYESDPSIPITPLPKRIEINPPPFFDLQLDNSPKCGFCNQIVNLNKEKCETLKADCNCYFHFDCVKNCKKINCNNCFRMVERKKMNALSYLYLETGYLNWVGPILTCKNKNCLNPTNPGRYGFCDLHNNLLASEKTIILALQYFVKFVKGTKTNKQDFFTKILYMFQSNFEIIKDWNLDFNEIHVLIKKL